MKKLWNGYQKHKDAVLVLTGLLAVSLIALPYLVLGEGSYVQVHDQLDGEVLNYIYQAKYLGQGKVIPQFMNGMDKAAMLPPAPLGVLFYRVLPPFAAFALMHWFCLAVGFLGMYGLGKKLNFQAEISWAAACLFCYIPFYPVYGLAALGQPMLVLCGLHLWEDQGKPAGNRTRKAAGKPAAAAGKTGIWSSLAGIWRYLLGISVYAAGSSLTLIGYAWVGLGLLWTAGLAVFRPKKTGAEGKESPVPALRVGLGVLVLLGVYLLTNLDLLRSLTGEGFTTHRQEMVLRAAEQPLAQMKELFIAGGAYSPVYSAGILAALALLTMAALAIRGRRRSGISLCLTKAWKLVGAISCGVLLAVLWNCAPVVEIRRALGGVVAYFQADRVYWIFPFAWILVLGYVLEGIWRLGCMGQGKTVDGPAKERVPRAQLRIQPAEVSHTADEDSELLKGACLPNRKIRMAAALVGCLVLIGIEGLQIFRDSTLNKNMRLMLLSDYQQVTWESIYMEEVFARIDEAIGADKDSCSVVSLGIYPSVALYNGYTCADGYSNNYDLAYKHLFRQIMAAELEENEEARVYFDDWGNRLYLAGAPHGINGMVAKGQGGYRDLDYDLDAMWAMGIRYLLAAAPVDLSEVSLENTALRLELVEGSPFSGDTSYYEVWVYRLEEVTVQPSHS